MHYLSCIWIYLRQPTFLSPPLKSSKTLKIVAEPSCEPNYSVLVLTERGGSGGGIQNDAFWSNLQVARLMRAARTTVCCNRVHTIKGLWWWFLTLGIWHDFQVVCSSQSPASTVLAGYQCGFDLCSLIHPPADYLASKKDGYKKHWCHTKSKIC